MRATPKQYSDELERDAVELCFCPFAHSLGRGRATVRGARGRPCAPAFRPATVVGSARADARRSCLQINGGDPCL